LESAIKEYALPAAAAFVGAFVVLRLLLVPKVARLALDRPNRRSLHAAPLPRTGGIAIAVGVMTGAALLPWHADLGRLGAGALLLFLGGLVEDVRGLRLLVRLVIQLLAVALALAPLCGGLEIPVLCGTLLVSMVWMVNLYNFMDGSDGLAGGMTLIGFGMYSAAALLAGDMQLAGLAGAIAASAFAFLLYNFHPARIFLGDCGSLPLGFLAAAIGLSGVERGHWSLVFVLLAFAPFIADATLTLARRTYRRERIWQAHRDHYYQRLVLMGLGHRDTALLAYAFMLATGTTALALRGARLEVQVAVLGAWSLAFVALAALADRRWERFRAERPIHEAR
jgi:UDP-N-acetylmuramyl pentapeptide phosphotransferase/UDP-N-acetylglucosamine-1-phosphate transferase